MSQQEINKFEAENFDQIIGWEKDFEKGQITFMMADKTKVTFKIIAQ